MGYRSSLKSSQSISDLSSHIPDRHHRPNRVSSGNKCLQSMQNAKLQTNPFKTQLNPNFQLKTQIFTNTGLGNICTENHEPIEKRLPKSQTMSCINERKKFTTVRPLTLTLKKTEKYKLSVNKANQSLPESPVCEELKLLKEACRQKANGFVKFAQKRRSCSYFIGLNENNDEDIDNIAKSFESLPAMNEQLSDNDDDGNGNFSDDSLESDYKNPPRRCVSEYQINLHAEATNDKYYLPYQKKKLADSQESILSDASGEVFDCTQYDNDRHSSASFFLSRRKMQAAQSQESILTDGTDDYQIFPLRENDDHRSTESILTDDSDSLVKSAPLEMLFDSHYKRKRQNSETYNANPKNTTEDIVMQTERQLIIPATNRPVFRSKSLQDTRLSTIKSQPINYTEENFRPNQTCIYYEFNVNDTKEYGTKIRSSTRCDVPRSNSLKEPHSMLILDNFVPHKPPKPKRNFSRTQSMRNRSRPAWNKYNVDVQSRHTTELNTTNLLNKDYTDQLDNRSSNANVNDVKSNEITTVPVDIIHTPINKQDINKLTPQCPTINNDTSINIDKQSSNTVVIQNIEIQPIKLEKFPRPDDIDVDSGFENQIPTKDTFEAYDSLEPNGTSSCDVSTSDSQTQDSNRDLKKKYDNLNTTVDIRISRAIEGTVKLLSKEFENLVRREQQYLVKDKYTWRPYPRDSNENFAKLEAERDRCSLLKRETRPSSGGEDSDCAMDKSLMESGSSTPGSSCANSPKRIWPPASRCQMKWTKTLPTICQDVLPSKHYFAGI